MVARMRDRAVMGSNPKSTPDDLVKIVTAHGQPEAEFLQGLLREEGVSSVLRRTRGSDVRELLAAGPCDVLVPASAAALARDVLLLAGAAPPTPGSTRSDAPLGS
jgi:hypothetical protein